MVHNPTVVGSKRGGKHPGAGMKKHVYIGELIYAIKLYMTHYNHTRFTQF